MEIMQAVFVSIVNGGFSNEDTGMSTGDRIVLEDDTVKGGVCRTSYCTRKVELI